MCQSRKLNLELSHPVQSTGRSARDGTESRPSAGSRTGFAALGVMDGEFYRMTALSIELLPPSLPIASSTVTGFVVPARLAP